MEHRTLPGTTMAVSTICLGTSEYGTVVPAEDAFRLLDLFIESGGTFLDTALVYADWIPGTTSVSEKTIGRWLKVRGLRDEVVVATKGGHPGLATMHVSRLSPADIAHDVDASLSHLQVERIDLYYLHRDDPLRPAGEIVEALHSQVRAGKLRYVACSNWCADRIREAQAHAARLGFEGFVADQMLWNLGVVDAEVVAEQGLVTMDAELRRLHAESGLAAVPYSSQAGGLFHKLMAGGEGRVHPSLDRTYPEIPNRQRLERLRHITEEHGLSVSQVVLGYLLSQPFVTVPVVGCKTEAHLRDTLSAADTRLAPAQVAYLERGARREAEEGVCPAV